MLPSGDRQYVEGSAALRASSLATPGPKHRNERTKTALSRVATTSLIVTQLVVAQLVAAQLPFAAAVAHAEPSGGSAQVTAQSGQCGDEPCDPPGGAARVFLYGASSGQPSTAKLVTLYSVYTLAVGSMAFGGVMLFDHLDDREATQNFLDDAGTQGPCFALTSRDCQRLEELRSDEQQSRNLAALGLAGAGTLMLAGLLTAEGWKNTQPTFSASEDGASFHVRFIY